MVPLATVVVLATLILGLLSCDAELVVPGGQDGSSASPGPVATPGATAPGPPSPSLEVPPPI